MKKNLTIGNLDELPERGAKGFDPQKLGYDTIFVVRCEQSVYAYHDRCPHYVNTTLPWRKDAYLDRKNEEIVCAAHGARFEITTGLCTSGPCIGETLSSLPLRIGKGGELLITLNENNNGGEI